MKKILLSLGLLFFIFSAKGQEYQNYGFRLGLTVHPTFGWVNQENVDDSNVKVGISYGLMGDFNFAENYSFTTGLAITSINSSIEAFTPAATTGATILSIKHQYIEIPLTVKLKTSAKNNLRGYGQFGLSNGFKVSNKSDKTVNNSDVLNIYRGALLIGGGLEFDVDTHTSIVGGITYNNGFTNIGEYNNNKLRSHYIALNLGIFF